MSGKRSVSAERRRRKARRAQKQKRQEIARSTVAYGDGGNDPRFDKPRTSPCPDCNIENRLRTTDLRPSPIGAIPLKPTSLSSWRPTASIGCETCDGTGTVELLEHEQYDPYDLAARKESREALEELILWRMRGQQTSSPFGHQERRATE